MRTQNALSFEYVFFFSFDVDDDQPVSVLSVKFKFDCQNIINNAFFFIAHIARAELNAFIGNWNESQPFCAFVTNTPGKKSLVIFDSSNKNSTIILAFATFSSVEYSFFRFCTELYHEKLQKSDTNYMLELI